MRIGQIPYFVVAVLGAVVPTQDRASAHESCTKSFVLEIVASKAGILIFQEGFVVSLAYESVTVGESSEIILTVTRKNLSSASARVCGVYSFVVVERCNVRRVPDGFRKLSDIETTVCDPVELAPDSVVVDRFAFAYEESEYTEKPGFMGLKCIYHEPASDSKTKAKQTVVGNLWVMLGTHPN